MNLLEWGEIFRVFAIGFQGGIAVLVGYGMGYHPMATYRAELLRIAEAQRAYIESYGPIRSN